ncbi:PREDICTED: hyaluronidase-1-like [Nanorana parkeri]|uniref:hyaluronidase-1-like n=1 Tax=Nanorana parkeri TaxID=125878 RepID=UPI000854E19B|nr:PREDICTED: hyaluronidase-1-like [Nanorana parkeri]
MVDGVVLAVTADGATTQPVETQTDRNNHGVLVFLLVCSCTPYTSHTAGPGSDTRGHQGWRGEDKILFKLLMMSSRTCSSEWLIWYLALFFTFTNGQRLKQAKSPMLHNKPFLAIWNAPTQQCNQRYKIDLDLSIFDIVANQNQTLSGQNVTIFYHTHLGYYPYVNDDDTSVNGGVPQNQSLTKHLSKAKEDVVRFVPNKDFQGLGVIDWENWRPLWDRNWDKKSIYRTKSIQLVKTLHPDWPSDLLQKQAKEEFTVAAKSFMSETVLLAQEIRPNGLWGYYLFPDCYNHDYKKYPDTYTGKCPAIEMKRNDYLQWMWKYSTALFPSIYLDTVLKSTTNAQKFVHHRLKEATRVAAMSGRSYELPIYAYARPFYSYTLDPLSKIDLINTIGESAALGAAGVVLWGGSDYSSTPNSCNLVKNYIDGEFGRYIVNVTSAAKLCSKVLCGKNGRCVRKNQNSATYLHLNPKNFKIKSRFNGKGHYVTGHHGKEDVQYMKHKFVCQCFEGWTGMFCEIPDPDDLKWRALNVKNGAILSTSFNIVLFFVFYISILISMYA